MRIPPAFLLIILLLGLAGCSVLETGFDVDVTVDPTLEGTIEVVSKRGDRPEQGNAIDVEIVLRNSGNVARKLEFQGSWTDDAGGFQGGVGDIRVINPGSEETFTTGTRAQRATSFGLAIRETESSADELLTATLARDDRNAPGHGITYTERPSLEEIPIWTPRGKANETPFTAGTILFLPTDRGWKLLINDREFDPLRGLAAARSDHRDLQTVSLNLPHEPSTGSIYRRDMEYGGGHFQIKQTPTSGTTTSWNTSIAWVIEITDWQRAPWDPKAWTYQRGGSASGRLYIAFKGSETGLGDSWISGTFRDVPIVYYGEPPES